MLERQKRLNFLPRMHEATLAYSKIFIILFAVYTIYEFLWVFPPNFSSFFDVVSIK